MNSLEMVLNDKEYLLRGTPCSLSDIELMEYELNLSFSEEYKLYLGLYGVVSYRGHELTGWSEEERLDVVKVTKFMREVYPESPKKMYVIEDLCIDGFVIWQDSEGKVYETQCGRNANQIARSLEEYIRNN